MDSKTAQTKLKELNGWSQPLEDALKSSHPDLFSSPESRGVFKIKKVNGKLFWYYRLSQRGSRMKYLCSTEPKNLKPKESSFQHAFNILVVKLESNFKIKTNESHLLHPYILEYISREARRGGMYFDIEKFKLVDDKSINKKDIKDNKNSARNRLLHIKGFYHFCKERNVPISIIPTRSLTNLVRNYLEETRDAGKKKDYLNEEKGETIRRPTAKNYLRSIRFFCDWICRDDALGGLELYDNHPFSVDFQISLIKEIYGKYIPPTDKNDMIIFRQGEYKLCVQECVEIVRKKWIKVCENEGDKSILRKGYYEKNESENLSGTYHKNQVADNPIGVDIVYFISLLQLRYGFRIGEILKVFRNKESMIKSGVSDLGVRSYLEVDKEDDTLYLMYVLNSKGRSRIVPIDETIWSFNHRPPKLDGKQLGKKVEVIREDGEKDYRWETNILDVCRYLWPDSYYLFTSPNYKTKPNQPYQSNYYMNLFKSKMVEEEKTIVRNRKGKVHKEHFNGLGWKYRNISSSHHLRKFFISYMIRQEDVSPMELCELTGHTMETMMGFYKRLDLESGRKTLQTNRVRQMLKKNKI